MGDGVQSRHQRLRRNHLLCASGLSIGSSLYVGKRNVGRSPSAAFAFASIHFDALAQHSGAAPQLYVASAVATSPCCCPDGRLAVRFGGDADDGGRKLGESRVWQCKNSTRRMQS